MTDLTFYAAPDLADGFGSTKGGRPNPHRGLDFPHRLGTPVPALCAGMVVVSEWHPVLGNIVQVRQDDGRFGGYRHLRSAAPRATVGARVARGTILGQVSNTGSAARGYHLCTTNSSNPRGVYGEAGVADPWPFIQAYRRSALSPAASAAVVSKGFVTAPGGKMVWPVGAEMKRLQKALKDRKRYPGKVDGDGGALTALGVQLTLNGSGRFGGISVPNGSQHGRLDSLLGTGAAWGVQEYAKDFGGYTGVQDGDPRAASWAGFIKGLETK